MKAYDVVILGTGPAGLQAAIHAARAKVTVVVLGRQPRSSLFRAHIWKAGGRRRNSAPSF